MMEQLGIRALRPGPSGNENAPNHANYDETKANVFGDLPDALLTKDGRRVTSPEMWWKTRRPEIVEDFEREVLGHVPKQVPKVNWSVAETVRTEVAGKAVIARQVVGRVDNSGYPEIAVEIQMTVVTPASAVKPAPVMIMFGRSTLPQAGAPIAAGSSQLIAAGWGYASLNPVSVQADNGAGLTKGIIGLVNHGQPRKPEDWGALRAWAWGASRALDFLQTDPSVDAKHVGIEGVSRYGKAALVAMAFDPRFAVVLIGSSGEGGTKPHRRNFGEAVENLTGSGEYHWMAGNFLKYGAAEAPFGAKTAADIPVDSNELIALCAPRLTFISYGIPEKGDAKWLDQQGSFMAAVAAGPVFRLLGARDLGIREDYRSARMPPVHRGLLDGELAWRQHDGGHTDSPNWPHFIAWANHHLGVAAPSDYPLPRIDLNSQVAHEQLLAKTRKGRIDVYFEGDSITRRWGATDYPELLAHFRRSFQGWNAADFGWGADTTQNILWRLNNGEMDGVEPKVVVLLAGTNNLTAPVVGERAASVIRGIDAIVRTIQSKAPQSVILLTGIFPRDDHPELQADIRAINLNLAKMADGVRIRFVNLHDQLTDRNGRLLEGMMPDRLHPSLKGYTVWAEALKPLLTEILGPPGTEDHAPPPTGDPSKQ